MKYAYIDGNTNIVLQWLHTDAYSDPSLPSADLLLQVDDAQYDAGQQDVWCTTDGQLTQQSPYPEAGDRR